MASPDPAPQRAIRQRVVRVMRLAAALAIISASLAVALVVRGQSENIRLLIAVALGIGVAVLLGSAIMTLIFLTSRRDDDAAAGSALQERDEP